MADEADLSDAREEAVLSAALAKQRAAAEAIPPGEPGDCDLCGEWSGRLVGGACAPCRDRYGLP